MGTWDSTYTSSANKTPLIFIWTKNGSKLIVFDQICGPKLTQILTQKWTKMDQMFYTKCDSDNFKIWMVDLTVSVINIT